MSVGERIRRLRKREGLTQGALAERLGVTPAAVGNYEHEFSFPKEDVLLKIFGALNCTPNELFGEDDLLTAEQRDMVGRYSLLDAHGKEIVNKVMELELKRLAVFEPSAERSGEGDLIAARNGNQTRLRFKDPELDISELPDYRGKRR